MNIEISPRKTFLILLSKIAFLVLANIAGAIGSEKYACMTFQNLKISVQE